MKKVTVIGATGMIGKPVTKELVRAGYQVTALVRDEAEGRMVLPPEVRLVQGDLRDKASLAQAMEGAEALYINISTTPSDKENAFSPEVQGLDHILEVAKNTPTLGQIAYLSSFLARNYQGDWWVMRAKKSSIERVKKSGIPYTIFYPSNFMENFSGGMVRNNKIMVPKVSAPNKAYWIAASDFGKMVAGALAQPKALNREYAVQGPEAFTMEEAARKYAAHYSKSKLSVSTMPFGIMKFLGIFIGQMRFLANLMGVMLSNKETFEAQATWDELGKPQLTLADFAQAQK